MITQTKKHPRGVCGRGGEGVRKYEIFPCVIPKHKGKRKAKPESVKNLRDTVLKLERERKLRGDRTYLVKVE